MENLTSTPSPQTSTTAMNGDKLSGQLTIKAQLGDDIRKMMIHNEDLTLNELVLMMERIFSGKISNSDELTIKYLDDDGDKITLLNDSDLTVALHFHKLLRLFVFVNGTEQISSKSTDKTGNQEEDRIDAKTFRTELQSIRNSVQTILDRLQLSTNEVPTTAVPSANAVSNTTHELDSNKQSVTPDNIRSNLNHSTHNEHQAPPVDARSVESANTNNTPPSTFGHAQMPTPYYSPPGLNNDQQAKTNVFGPPPTNFPGMPPLPNNAPSRYPSATTPNSSTPPTYNPTNTPPPSSVGHPSAFMGQQPTAPPPQVSGFYGQQPAFYQQRPPHGNFNAPNTFPPQQAATSPTNSSPATINPSFVQAPPPMASQQPYGAYPPQNSYYNPIQQYPKTS